ncbi:unnamed protein product [Bursaphelenchus okinawaensis]|uniref:beta-N-acetylhexosaminidase n=1 Tax=Bursaphelenchus okinawaensis TaxID=465554 RepID=A0A811KHC4_9BILA|nr:unnamed protein product [Bursaphelenchus okinawaensis]CAG9103325.1 unnamed protein product [Bursaphelenchus okinawaensis]
MTIGRPENRPVVRRYQQEGFNEPVQYRGDQPESKERIRPVENDSIQHVVPVQNVDNVFRNNDTRKQGSLGSADFIPEKRLVHLDLKGGAYRPEFYPKLFDLFLKAEFTGILLEWEEMFPFTGKLQSAVNGDAYTLDEVKGILNEAKKRNLEVIPLVQTFGHLEWLLKLKEFVHFREDPKYANVICFGREESFDLIKDMIDQVANVHKEFGMTSFHMGADEVYHVGICEESRKKMDEHKGKDRVILWHMSRVAKYIQEKHSVNVLAWHDMFAHIMESDLMDYRMTSLIEPMLWSYAEDLDYYLPYQTWISLKPFKNVWAASAFKGADGPGRWISNPMHYIKNHESWIKQFERAKTEVNIRGLVYTGWSRYDHLATLCELLPTTLPQLLMSQETILEGKPLKGNYMRTRKWLGCQPTTELGDASFGCQFPGREVYEIVNRFYQKRLAAEKYIAEDYDFNGWMSKVAEELNFTSPMKLETIIPLIDQHLMELQATEKEFRMAMALIYFQETIDEYVYLFMADVINTLKRRKAACIQNTQSGLTYAKRPFIKYPGKQEL